MPLNIERPAVPAGGTVVVDENSVSWGAIIAGAVCALALQIVFALLTAGMGLSSASEGEGVSWGAGIFFAITAIASMFAGGSIAGRLAGHSTLPTATLHGIVVWALVMIGVVWMGVSVTGAALRGATQVVQTTGSTVASVAGGAAGAAGSALSAVAPDAEQFDEISLDSLLPPSVEADLRQMTGNADLTPDAIAEQGREIMGAVIDREDLENARDIAIGAGRQMLRAPGDAKAIFDAAATEMTAPDGPLGEQQFDELQGALATRYGISPQQSEEIANRWRGEFVQARDAAVQGYREAYDQAAQAVNDAAEAATEAAKRAADAAASVAWWSAIGGFLGLLAAAAGAAFGRPEDIVATPRTVTTRV